MAHPAERPRPARARAQSEAEGSELSKKRRKDTDDGGIGDKAIKWAQEFEALGEDDQYTFLEELAPRMRCVGPTCASHTHCARRPPSRPGAAL